MMHGPIPDQAQRPGAAASPPLVAALARGLGLCNNIIVVFAAIALIAACAILSYSVLSRALFHSPNYWQDEAAVFLLVGATFMTAAYVQGQRGHVWIEAFVGLLSPLANRIRLWLVDVASLAFCAFFAWKSWTLAHEAYVDGQVSNSMWSPPLAIPYVLMAVGMTLLCVQTPAADHHSLDRSSAPMSVFRYRPRYGFATLFAMFSGMPIAFALGAVAVVFMAIYMPAASLDTVTQNVYEEMASITLLSIPLFILKGAAIGKSRAGQDLYSALHAWLHRVPGGLGVANVFACALFAAMAGSSPATCSAIGSAGIPEMRKRGYSGGFAAGIIAAGGTLGILLPPSITMILFAVAAEKSLGRLFLAGIGPGLLLVTLFGVYAVFRFRKEYAAADAAYETTGAEARDPRTATISPWPSASACCRACIPFVLLLTGVMIALYGGYATPSETAGLGGLLALALIAAIYSVWRPSDLAPIMKSTIRDSTMLMMIIGMSLLYSYVMSYLHISQSAAEADRRDASAALGPAGRDPRDGGRARLLPAAGLDHPDDRADHPAAAPCRQFRYHLVRRGHDHRDGDGPDPSAGRPEHLRHPQRRARHSPERGDLGHAAVRAADDARGAAAVLLPGDLDRAAGPGDGAGREQVAAFHRIIACG